MSIQPPTRLASEDVIINAPMSYVGSVQRIMRLRRRADAGGALVAMTVLAVVLVVVAWVFITAWYLAWGLWLVPYRLLRRGARKRTVEAMRHRELMGTIQGSAAASAAAIAPLVYVPTERIGDADRERVIEQLREEMLTGTLTSEEFEERLGLTHQAITRADLTAVTMDLPTNGAEQRSQATGSAPG